VNRETAERCTILRGLVGSTVHGLNVNDSIEDRDEMGICVEPLEEAMALWAPFEQFIYRSAAEREGRENARSIAGDLDLTIYSLRKWMRLALKGNPTILLLLFTPDDQIVHCDSLGRELRSLAPQIISRRVRGPYLGYLQAQKERLTGERGQKRIQSWRRCTASTRSTRCTCCVLDSRAWSC
jgi:predicted nucleotidyltransferase